MPVKEAYDRFRQMHFIRPFDPAKPVILFLHGSGDGPFKRFEALIGQLQAQYNLAVFGYDNYAKMEVIAAELNEQWQAAGARYTVRPPYGIVTHSYGDVNNPRSHRLCLPGKSRLRQRYEKMREGSRFVLLKGARHDRAPTDPRVVEAAGKFFKEMLASPSSGTGLSR